MLRVALFLLSASIALPAVAACPSLSFFKGKKYSGAGEVIAPEGTFFVTYSQTFSNSMTGSGVPSQVSLHGSGSDPNMPASIQVTPTSFDRANCRAVSSSSDGQVGVAHFYDNGRSFHYVGSTDSGTIIRTTAHLQ